MREAEREVVNGQENVKVVKRAIPTVPKLK